MLGTYRDNFFSLCHQRCNVSCFSFHLGGSQAGRMGDEMGNASKLATEGVPLSIVLCLPSTTGADRRGIAAQWSSRRTR